MAWHWQEGGRGLLLRMAKLLRIGDGPVGIVERWFQRSGAWMVFSRACLVPYALLSAGISGMSWSRFLLAFYWFAVWCSAMLGIGWCGKRWSLLSRLCSAYTVPALCALALVLVIYILGMMSVKRYCEQSIGLTRRARGG